LYRSHRFWGYGRDRTNGWRNRRDWTHGCLSNRRNRTHRTLWRIGGNGRGQYRYNRAERTHGWYRSDWRYRSVSYRPNRSGRNGLGNWSYWPIWTDRRRHHRRYRSHGVLWCFWCYRSHWNDRGLRNLFHWSYRIDGTTGNQWSRWKHRTNGRYGAYWINRTRGTAGKCGGPGTHGFLWRDGRDWSNRYRNHGTNRLQRCYGCYWYWCYRLHRSHWIHGTDWPDGVHGRYGSNRRNGTNRLLRSEWCYGHWSNWLYGTVGFHWTHGSTRDWAYGSERVHRFLRNVWVNWSDRSNWRRGNGSHRTHRPGSGHTGYLRLPCLRGPNRNQR
jgi:hypothetical protein